MRSDCSFTKTLLLHTRSIYLFNYFEPCLWQAKGKHFGQEMFLSAHTKNNNILLRPQVGFVVKSLHGLQRHKRFLNFTCTNDPLDANVGGVYLFGEFLHSLRRVFICVWVHVGLYTRERHLKRGKAVFQYLLFVC